jgi:hypothetical protein
MSSLFKRYRQTMRDNWHIEVPEDASSAGWDYAKNAAGTVAAVGAFFLTDGESAALLRSLAIAGLLRDGDCVRYTVAAACSAHAALPDGVRTPIDEAAFYTALVYVPTTPVALMTAMARMGIRLEARKAAQISRGAVRYRRRLLAEA